MLRTPHERGPDKYRVPIATKSLGEPISALTRANTCFIAETGRDPCIIPILGDFLSDEIYFIISKPMNTTDAGIPV